MRVPAEDIAGPFPDLVVASACRPSVSVHKAVEDIVWAD